jgi:hypothetical protein
MHVSLKPLRDTALRRAARFASVWQPTPLPIARMIEAKTRLREARVAIGHAPIPMQMSYRVGLSSVTGKTPPAGPARPAGHGSCAQVADELRIRLIDLLANQ